MDFPDQSKISIQTIEGLRKLLTLTNMLGFLNLYILSQWTRPAMNISRCKKAIEIVAIYFLFFSHFLIDLR